MNNDIKEFKKIRAEINERVDFSNTILSITSVDRGYDFNKLYNLITEHAREFNIDRKELAIRLYNIIAYKGCESNG